MTTPDRPLGDLNDHELIQLLAGRRLRELDAPYESLRDLVDLVDRTMAQLRHELGLGPAGAKRLAAAVELHRRVAAPRPKRTRLHTPEAVSDLVAVDLELLTAERLLCLPLDARSNLIGHPLRPAPEPSL